MPASKTFKPTTELFKEWATTQPERIAVQIEEEVITYGELADRINCFSTYLLQSGIGLQDNVVIFMDRSIDCIVAMLSVLNIGCVYVPIDPVHAASRIHYIAEDAKPHLIITTRALSQEVELPATRVCLFEEVDLSDFQAPPIDIPINPAYVMYILYTSGTTGQPKGVLVHHEGAENLLDEIKREWPMHKNILQFASLGFDASIPEWAGTLSSGGKIVMIKNRQLILGNQLLELVRRQEVSFMKMPAAVLTTLDHTFELPTLETVVTAGDACNQELVRKWSPGRNFYNCYGPTENSIGSTRSHCFAEDEGVNIGRPVQDVFAYILDEDLEPVGPGEVGEIYLGGKGVAYGYNNKPLLTAQKFLPDPFHGVGQRMYKTGDLGRWLADGNIDFVGRIDNQVKINGYRIELEEINAALKKSPFILEASVIPVFEEKNQYLIAFYQPAEGGLPVAQIKASLKEQLPAYMIPSRFQPLERFRLTASGKVDGVHLRKHYRDYLEVEVAEEKGVHQEESDSKDVSTVLLQIWQTTLELDAVTANTDFFEQGGGSMDAARLIGDLQAALGVAPTVADLYENPRFEDFEKLSKKFVDAFILTDTV
ncbi:MAG: non-ribosomal peptide synthetase [Bacteroidota bacterium]